MKYSLRHYLLISILLTLIVTGGVTVWGGYRASVHEVEELFDAQLSRSAKLMLGLVLAEVNLGHMKEFSNEVKENSLNILDKKRIEEEVYQQGHFYELKLAYQVWDSYGNMILRSANAPLQPMSELQQGYANQFFNKQNWRTFALRDSSKDYQVITAERDDVREDLVNKITLQMTWPFVLLLPIMGGLVWYFVSRGLSPLESVAEEIARRKSEQLHALEVNSIPTEIRPLVDELNHLFSSLRLSFDKERRFTSDAAHELRTPLAALKVHLQLMQSSKSEADKQAALIAVSQGVDRASHMVDQLLGLARLDPQAIRATQQMARINLSELCVNQVAEVYPLANEKKQTISFLSDESIYIQAYLYPFESLLRNLLSNAVTYTPEEGEIVLLLKKKNNVVHIYLHDSGPGIPVEQRENVLQRFRKVEGNAHSGSGIGLSIVKLVAELHNMQVMLESSSRLGGLCVHLQLEL
jgi:signal transduction histidine kinase